jgi:Ca-activated chloride channel homolog
MPNLNTPHKGTWDWLDTSWFSLETLYSFTFEKPLILYTILGIPLLFMLRWLFFFRFRQRLKVAFFSKKQSKSISAWFRHVPTLLLACCLACLLVAMARPQRTDETTEQNSEGIDIMLLLDISESMQGEDFKPNRLEAAKVMARKFINGRQHDRIGLVVFAGDAYSLAPLTTDYDLLYQYLEDLDFQMIQKPGTAIGSAVGVATNRMRESVTKSKVMILLSDGENTAGNIDPFTAADLAKAFGIKIYTIAVGMDGPVAYGKDVFGNPQYVQNTLNETTLRKIASIGEGQFFRAVNNQALASIFKRIDKFEKAEITETRFQETRDYYDVYVKWGLLFFLIWMLSKVTFMSNALED